MGTPNSKDRGLAPPSPNEKPLKLDTNKIEKLKPWMEIE